MRKKAKGRRFLLKKVISCILISMLLLWGCVPRDDAGALQRHIAEEARVICENCPGLISRTYQEDGELNALLEYIRSLGPLSPAPDTPHSSDPRAATMIFTMADGSKKVYRQLGNDYLRIDYGPWLQLPKGKGAHLWQLLSDTPEKPDK